VTLGGWQVGAWIVILTLLSEGALLFVAAQTGFIDGPRVLANMAMDSWIPHRFANLSERLVSQNGIMVMGFLLRCWCCIRGATSRSSSSCIRSTSS